MGMGNFEGGKGHPIVKLRGDSVVIAAKTAKPIEMAFGLWAWMGRRNHVLDGGPDGADGRCHGNQFWDAVCYNWLCGL